MERAEAEAIYGQGREAVVAVLLRMDEQIERLERRVAQQDERIAELERRLGRSSRNSSQPPSADPPSAAPERGEGRSGRSQGGQPGHEGKGRELLPISAVDEVIEHWPDRRSARRGRPERVRPQVGGGGRDAVGSQPHLAPRRGGAVSAAVLRADQHRQRRGDPAARRRRADRAL